MKSLHIPLFVRILPAYILIAVLVSIHVLTLNHISSSVSKKSTIPSVQSEIKNIPLVINIPSVDINLPVKRGGFDFQRKDWILDDDGAYYADMTSLLNENKGNTLLYAHDFSNLFGPLNNLKEGDKAFVKTAEKKVYEYKYLSKKEVSPNDLSILNYSGPSQLTLLTCGGIFDTKRQLFTFTFVAVH